MAQKEDVSMGDILPVLSASIASNSYQQELSPEDAAWVDSCLEPNPFVPDHEWGPLSEALLEALTTRFGNESAQVEPELPTEGRDGIQVDFEEGAESRDEEENELIRQLKKADIFSQEEPVEEDEENELVEGFGKVQIGSQEEEIESRDNIFMVWDLKWPEEEDEESELMKQLKKVLLGSKTGRQADAAEEQLSVEELVAGIGDLSLEQSNLSAEDRESSSALDPHCGIMTVLRH